MSRVRLAVLGGAASFCLVAVLNCGGYRYGIGDQAFYIPAVMQHLSGDLFPRDRFLLHAQDRFMVLDDVTATVARTFGVSLPVIFLSAYVLATLLLFGGLVLIGRTMYRSWWTVAALAAVLTLRHRITQTGANTLEAYFHPRMLAFALGVWAIATYLRGKGGIALFLVALACAMHPTTGLWFSIWMIVALAVSETKWRAPLATLGAVGAALAVWIVSFGPLRGHLVHMDSTWASVLEGKDYIFPSDWGPSFWLVNFGYLAVAALAYHMRRRRGLAIPQELGFVVGAVFLAIAFLISWPMMSAGIALALQLQTSRVFWMLDFLASIYLAWLFVEVPPLRVRRAVVTIIITVAVLRGIYVTRIEHAGRPIVEVGLTNDDWIDAMRWIARTPTNTHVLADPGHAWKYGVSARVAGERDTYLEEVKDAAVGLYSRDVAMWVLGRIQDVNDFDRLTPPDLQTLAVRYDLNYLVVDRDVALPLAYRNKRFRIYHLGRSAP